MRPFSCSVCSQMVFFHNTECLRCHSELVFDPKAARLTVDDHARRCANRSEVWCNWAVEADEPGELCASCRLTSVRPGAHETEAIEQFAEAESAKRRLLDQLGQIGLPVVGRDVDPDGGVAFEFLSSRERPVTTGHAGGVITLDLSESDDAHRVFVREQLGEPYRTVLGHLRHEIGHWYWDRLVAGTSNLAGFRRLFGDERVSYEEALATHYGDGEVDRVDDLEWVDTHVSRYATMHPWEDWAETFAHYLHIRAGVDTAEQFGLHLGDPVRSAARAAFDVAESRIFGDEIASWLALTLALNGMSRAMGQNDLYPFVLSRTVIEKLDSVHRLVVQAAG
ncbi:MAG: putative zinc-binding metallopeptidase [Ilumatobacter sp.]